MENLPMKLLLQMVLSEQNLNGLKVCKVKMVQTEEMVLTVSKGTTFHTT